MFLVDLVLVAGLIYAVVRVRHWDAARDNDRRAKRGKSPRRHYRESRAHYEAEVGRYQQAHPNHQQRMETGPYAGTGGAPVPEGSNGVGFDLRWWSPSQRLALSHHLTQNGIAHRWNGSWLEAPSSSRDALVDALFPQKIPEAASTHSASSQPAWASGGLSHEQHQYEYRDDGPRYATQPSEARKLIGVLLSFAAIILLVSSIAEFTTQPKAPYDYVASSTGATSVEMVTCLSAWQHFSAAKPATWSEFVQDGWSLPNAERATAACGPAIAGRDHVSGVLLVLALVAAFSAVVIVRGRRSHPA